MRSRGRPAQPGARITTNHKLNPLTPRQTVTTWKTTTPLTLSIYVQQQHTHIYTAILVGVPCPCMSQRWIGTTNSSPILVLIIAVLPQSRTLNTTPSTLFERWNKSNKNNNWDLYRSTSSGQLQLQSAICESLTIAFQCSIPEYLEHSRIPVKTRQNCTSTYLWFVPNYKDSRCWSRYKIRIAPQHRHLRTKATTTRITNPFHLFLTVIFHTFTGSCR